MKTVAIFGRELNHHFKDDILFLLNYLKEKGVAVQVHKKYLKKLESEFLVDLEYVTPFSSTKNKHSKPDLLISIGGDGTFFGLYADAKGNGCSGYRY